MHIDIPKLGVWLGILFFSGLWMYLLGRILVSPLPKWVMEAMK
jgi:hypothetical protein